MRTSLFSRIFSSHTSAHEEQIAVDRPPAREIYDFAFADGAVSVSAAPMQLRRESDDDGSHLTRLWVPPRIARRRRVVSFKPVPVKARSRHPVAARGLVVSDVEFVPSETLDAALTDGNLPLGRVSFTVNRCLHLRELPLWRLSPRVLGLGFPAAATSPVLPQDEAGLRALEVALLRALPCGKTRALGRRRSLSPAGGPDPCLTPTSAETADWPAPVQGASLAGGAAP
jgi:hypothetical protein